MGSEQNYTYSKILHAIQSDERLFKINTFKNALKVSIKIIISIKN